jgi:hypothetical protein
MMASRRKMSQISKVTFRSLLILAFLLFVFSTVCNGEEAVNPRFMITTGANFFIGSQTEYRQIYGKIVFMPEIKITGLIYRNFTAWGSFGLIGKSGLIEDVDENAYIRQTFLSFGAGYALKLSATLRLRGELGLTFISFKEEALEETVKGSGIGLKIGANLDCFISKKIFATLTTAYNTASDEAQTGKIKLGGFQVGAGLGFAF